MTAVLIPWPKDAPMPDDVYERVLVLATIAYNKAHREPRQGGAATYLPAPPLTGAFWDDPEAGPTAVCPTHQRPLRRKGYCPLCHVYYTL